MQGMKEPHFSWERFLSRVYKIYKIGQGSWTFNSCLQKEISASVGINANCVCWNSLFQKKVLKVQKHCSISSSHPHSRKWNFILKNPFVHCYKSLWGSARKIFVDGHSTIPTSPDCKGATEGISTCRKDICIFLIH